MKRYICVFLAIVLCLTTACSNQLSVPSASNNADNSTMPTIAPPEEYAQQNCYKYLIETEIGTYYLNNIEGNGLVQFASRGSKEFYYLCGRADCGHSDENCDAYAGHALGYYNNHLYSVVGLFEFKLIQMNMDGSNHKEITTLKEPIWPDGTGGGAYEFFFHNGYLIYEVGPPETATKKYFRTNLETGEIVELFDGQMPAYSGNSSSYTAYGDNIYWENYNFKTDAYSLIQGNIETNTLTVLKENAEFNGPPAVYGHTLYRHEPKVGFWEYNLETGEDVLKSPTDFLIAQTLYTKDYIFANTTVTEDWSDWNLYIYDYDYNLIDQMHMDKAGPNDTRILFVTSDTVYFSQYESCKISHYLNLSDIGSGNLELTPVPDPYAIR